MQAMSVIRTWQLQQLDNNMIVYTHTLSGTSPDDARTLRDGDEGWTVLQVMGHLRDFEAVFVERAKLTLSQDNPALPFPNPDELAAEQDYNSGDLLQYLAEWTTLRRELLAVLAPVADADWERPATHPTRGNFTLTDQLFLTVWHDTNHLAQISKILSMNP